MSQPRFTRTIAGLAVVALTLPACSSGTHHPATPSPSPTTSDSFLSSLENGLASETGLAPETSSEPPAVQTLKLGATAHIYDDSYEWTGTFDMAVVRPLSVVKRDNGDRILAFAVTVSNVQEAADSDGLSTFDGNSSNLFTAPPPLADDSVGGAGDDSLANAPSRAACGNCRPLAEVTQDVTKPVTGCVWFYLSPGEQPNTISYSSDTTDPAGTVEASWPFTMPGKAAAPVFEGLTYAVTSDGGINSVTYSMANFGQAQDTDVQGSSWTKSLPQGSEPRYPILTAQAGDGASTISCKITVDGEVKAQQTSHGQYAVVTCSAQ